MEKKKPRPETPEKLFAQVIQAAEPEILKIWEDGDRLIKQGGIQCPEEIEFRSDVGRSYYQCQPHFWQCYWKKGTTPNPAIKIDLFGQSFHVEARASFDAIPAYSVEHRFYQIIKKPELNIHYGMLVDLSVKEIPGMSWPILLTDTCRDSYLPERIYGYGKIDPKKRDEGFIWDNVDRKIFIDRFYVSTQQVNEWRILTGESEKVNKDRKEWPLPARLSLADQKSYCQYFGKRLMEAKLFDAATMAPQDTKNPFPDKVLRPQTPWQRDLSKSFLGMARINQDYQLTPLDCQLAQVEGCKLKYYSTDSASWMGMNYALGFFPEAFLNDIEPSKNVKISSRFMSASSPAHELGMRSKWSGEQEEGQPTIAFRCYEEVSL